ncbi:DNA uptake porin HofQ [Budvicia diplopodorum]|uniref:DNA uptake porin HofQ n=1 Tax=Budvicia diplopodorum TaxID=1119056 RepID=UPI001FE7C9DD|nr:DNA uptake porin HofQ [Budvicia diplopodorum]
MFKAFLLIFNLLFTSSLFAQPAVQDKPISLEFQDAPLSVILQALADYQHLNLVVMDSVGGKLSIRLDNVPWKQALSVILKAGQLDVELDGNVMVVMPLQEKDARRQRSEQTQQEQTAQLPLTTFKHVVQYADVNELVKMVNSQKGSLLSERGSVIADARTNTIIVRDLGDSLPAVEEFIKHIDQPQPQVLLTAHIVTMNHENLEELGVKWGLSSDVDSSSNAMGGMFDVNLSVANPTARIGFQVARLKGKFLNLELSALESENHVDIIASPRLLTVNKQTASIKQGTEIPYEVSSGSNGATSIEFKQAVLGLEVTPRIFQGGQLELDLLISQNMPGKSLKKGDGSEILTIDTQEIKTQVSVFDGETIVLGGIFQQTNISGTESVPLLGDIPLLGTLFQRKSDKQSRRELVIFITPTIVTPSPIISENKIESG